ncbi:MAG TPA: hypothetical protein VKM55_10860 [Candidatus Lokiarchaeia archaeon]|nr:hypothetical protein [Candidatus Lokiarchaeia archaeon]
MPWIVSIPNRLLQEPADVRNLMTGCFGYHLLEPEKLGDTSISIRVLKQDFFDPVSHAVSTPSWYLEIN